MGDISMKAPNAQELDLIDIDLEFAARLQAVDVEDSPFGEYIMDCPVCKSAVRYFFMNFNEKFKMCENKECDYPFGYEELEFVKQSEMFASDEELDCATIMSRRTSPGSVISTAAWSDIDKLRAFEPEDQSDILTSHENDAARAAKIEEITKQKEADLQTKKNLQDIKRLNTQLKQAYEEEETLCIRNEKWIKHLSKLQNLSGVQLLKKEEMDLIKKEEIHSANKLTIGITTNNNSITINLAEPSTSSAKPLGDGGGKGNTAIA